MNVQLTDEEMIRQHLSQAPNQCFEALYKRYVSKVYQRCLFMTKDSEQAQDFTHDIFIKAFDKLEAFQQRSSFSTWLNSIAHNYCSDQLRLARRLNVTSINEGLEDSLGESREAQLTEESIQLVRMALASLPAKEQALLRLKYEDGLSIEQISELYKIKTSAVKMRLKRSRAKIQEFYNQHYTI
ncbi:RNA polymerase sigma factor [Spirosoma validum]|uniref:Sigma-70 family RNA polymerase sigma factor n=1 Tax=Spirosoma validum TaxID=2771355 RepID=A0A927AZ58_9BACT|nr:sigma-70 family RNA polymerase sigma factor [Spirosoma validum]MBD2752555.1 sigma-70 family RNA polymerase sigma factor [Spirosoma validum]